MPIVCFSIYWNWQIILVYRTENHLLGKEVFGRTLVLVLHWIDRDRLVFGGQKTIPKNEELSFFISCDKHVIAWRKACCGEVSRALFTNKMFKTFNSPWFRDESAFTCLLLNFLISVPFFMFQMLITPLKSDVISKSGMLLDVNMWRGTSSSPLLKQQASFVKFFLSVMRKKQTHRKLSLH